jgi:hypothetical protein
VKSSLDSKTLNVLWLLAGAGILWLLIRKASAARAATASPVNVTATGTALPAPGTVPNAPRRSSPAPGSRLPVRTIPPGRESSTDMKPLLSAKLPRWAWIVAGAAFVWLALQAKKALPKALPTPKPPPAVKAGDKGK